MTESADSAKTTNVKIAQAKGRPMLSWVGKRPLRDVVAFPAQEVERFTLSDPEAVAEDVDWSEWPNGYPQGGLLFHGDNKEVLAHLLANGFRGRIDLVYIDPPFDSGADYVRRVQLRGATGSARLDGEGYTLGEQIQYTDIWANDTYLQFIYERLLLLKELLSEKGNLWLHCDPARGHYLKCLMDEVFGGEHFVNQVVWKRSDAHSDVGQGAKHLGTVHDMLLLYAKGGTYTWHGGYLPLPESTVKKWYRHVEPETGRHYNLADVTGPGGAAKGNPVYEWKGVTKAWRYSKTRMGELDRQGLVVYTESGMPYQKRYLDESKGVPLQDWWDDIHMVRGIQRRGEAYYPTEKPEPLLERILAISSRPTDLVLDCFIGSGTTAAVAQALGRRWIGCDINKGAIQATTKRLIDGMREQAEARSGQTVLSEADTALKPAQVSFTTYRVNDYDLAIQHNEAVNLACEHIGVVRSHTDSFFDGTLGKDLVKIVPFDHPASPTDLEAITQELRNRPEEDRDVVAVCLGKELACAAWLADYNRKGAPNKIRLIELRTDPRYGQFFAHEGASADVRVSREDGCVRVEIEDFISPTIVTRLKQQAGIVAPQITDWRAMVDSVLIDSAYDGQVFNVVLADVPEKRSDLVSGKYELPRPSGSPLVAVKITDMLGEEVLVVAGAT